MPPSFQMSASTTGICAGRWRHFLAQASEAPNASAWQDTVTVPASSPKVAPRLATDRRAAPGALPDRDGSRRGRNGESLPRCGHSSGPRGSHQDFRGRVQRAIRTRGADHLGTQSSPHLHAIRRRPRLPGDGAGGGRNLARLAQTFSAVERASRLPGRSSRRFVRRMERASSIATSSRPTSWFASMAT